MDDSAKGEAHYNDFKIHDYNILETDYDNYAVIYGCDEFLYGLFHI